MANAAELAKGTPARVLVLGYPGAGKTGALVSLANAGLKLRILAYDKAANFQPLLNYTKPEFLKNIDIVFLEDKLRGGPKCMEPVGIPEAFAQGLKLLDNWEYENGDGTKTSLGRSREWGPDTVVVVDSLTALGEAAMRRATAMANRTVTSRTQAVWGHAMSDQYSFLEKLTGSGNRHHVVVTAHLKTVGPDDITANDDDATKDLKGRLIELVPTRLYATALGKGNARTVASLFGSAVVLIEPKFKNGKLQVTADNPSGRYLYTTPREELDLRVAALNLPDELPISTGLLSVFEATTGGQSSWFPKDVLAEEKNAA